MRKILISELETGMVLANDVIDHDGRIIYPKGRILTDRQIQKLQEIALPFVPVQDTIESNLGPHPATQMKTVLSSTELEEKRPYIRYLFQHVNLEQPLMAKLYEECTTHLPNNATYQSHKFFQKSPMELVTNIKKMPVLPTVYARLSELINTPESSSADMANVINDSGLAAVVLKTVNSAYFGLNTKVDSISRAITILGTRQLCELVMAFTVIQSFEGIPQKFVNIESFCQHSIACGLFARELASATHHSNVERFFTAGLLHDIGRLVLFSQCAEEFIVALSRSRESDDLLYEWEKRIFGFDHGEVGAALLEHWGLPENLQEAVKFHHNPTLAPKQSIESYVVHFADILTNALQLGTSGEYLVPPMQEDTMAKINLNPAYIPPLIDKVVSQVDEILKVILGKNN